jgi:hypothetical protein
MIVGWWVIALFFSIATGTLPGDPHTLWRCAPWRRRGRLPLSLTTPTPRSSRLRSTSSSTGCSHAPFTCGSTHSSSPSSCSASSSGGRSVGSRSVALHSRGEVGERELERRSDHSWGHHGPHMSLVRDVDVTWIKAMKKNLTAMVGGIYVLCRWHFPPDHEGTVLLRKALLYPCAHIHMFACHIISVYEHDDPYLHVYLSLHMHMCNYLS